MTLFLNEIKKCTLFRMRFKFARYLNIFRLFNFLANKCTILDNDSFANGHSYRYADNSNCRKQPSILNELKTIYYLICYSNTARKLISTLYLLFMEIFSQSSRLLGRVIKKFFILYSRNLYQKTLLLFDN